MEIVGGGFFLQVLHRDAAVQILIIEKVGISPKRLLLRLRSEKETLFLVRLVCMLQPCGHSSGYDDGVW